MNLLQLIQQTCDELALSRPTAIVSSPDPQVRQLFALLNRFGNDLCRFDWQRLEREHTITTVAGQRTYPLPADWKKQIPQTEWGHGNRGRIFGPQTPQSWSELRSGIANAGPRRQFRIVNNMFELNPAPDAGQVITYMYVSKAWVRGQDGTPKTSFTADTDEPVFDESLLVDGLKTKFKQAKGLDVTFELSEFNGNLERCLAQDRSAPVLSLSSNYGARLLDLCNVPDGNWHGR